MDVPKSGIPACDPKPMLVPVLHQHRDCLRPVLFTADNILPAASRNIHRRVSGATASPCMLNYVNDDKKLFSSEEVTITEHFYNTQYIAQYLNREQSEC
jgi:hypothetical protein